MAREFIDVGAFDDTDIETLRRALEAATAEVKQDAALVDFIVRNYLAKRLFRVARKGMDAGAIAIDSVSRLRLKAAMTSQHPAAPRA
jgi:hypothetical protein